MARRIEYVGGGRIRDAKTLDLISPQKVVSEYNEMAARLEVTENASDMARKTAPHRTHETAMNWNPEDYEIADELCHADIDALPPEKVAAAIRARRTVLSAVSGSTFVMDKVYARAAELLDVMAEMAKERCKM